MNVNLIGEPYVGFTVQARRPGLPREPQESVFGEMGYPIPPDLAEAVGDVCSIWMHKMPMGGLGRSAFPRKYLNAVFMPSYLSRTSREKIAVATLTTLVADRLGRPQSAKLELCDEFMNSQNVYCAGFVEKTLQTGWLWKKIHGDPALREKCSAWADDIARQCRSDSSFAPMPEVCRRAQSLAATPKLFEDMPWAIRRSAGSATPLSLRADMKSTWLSHPSRKERVVHALRGWSARVFYIIAAVAVLPFRPHWPVLAIGTLAHAGYRRGRRAWARRQRAMLVGD